ncbi:MAG: type II toxin-antitoxin system prevent-host-death family antitoxin [Coriobacteriales bacterium]|jgi:prevent-host-death family protein|nr:type II toxin-antitoxin system prevent-host-death family antitoxin [Coriobacteriales bacterium]
MLITATELKNNLGKYLELAASEDVLISKNGRVAAKLANPYKDRVESARSLIGILPGNVTAEDAREARLGRKWQ